MDESDDKELHEDFGARLSVADCDRLLARARESNDRDLRLLVRQYLKLRRTAADALAYVAERNGDRTTDFAPPKGSASYPLGALRFLLEDFPKRD
jgi:hypothetical protein